MNVQYLLCICHIESTIWWIILLSLLAVYLDSSPDVVRREGY